MTSTNSRLVALTDSELDRVAGGRMNIAGFVNGAVTTMGGGMMGWGAAIAVGVGLGTVGAVALGVGAVGVASYGVYKMVNSV